MKECRNIIQGGFIEFQKKIIGSILIKAIERKTGWRWKLN